ncbi:MAG: metallophosphoesterase [Eubacteriales bacterium]|nr:metallophosphoesterase [Eubacteriales bacterium]
MARHKEKFVIDDNTPQKHRLRTFLLLLLCLALIAVLYVLVSSVVMGQNVQVLSQRVPLPSMHKTADGFTVLHISDIHGNELGENMQKLRTALSGKSYRLVCITGDLTGKNGDYSAFMDVLDAVGTKAPVVFIPGDEDPVPIVQSANATDAVLADYITAAQAKGAVYLDRPYEIILSESASVWLMPQDIVSLDLGSFRNSYVTWQNELNAGDIYQRDAAQSLRVCEYQLTRADDIEALNKKIRETDVKIALTHSPLQPDTIRTLLNWDSNGSNYLKSIDLILAGHYNGGQVRVPGLGAIYIPGKWWPAQDEVQGLNRINGITQYISPGLGVSRAYFFPARIFNAPAVTILTLKQSME